MKLRELIVSVLLLLTLSVSAQPKDSLALVRKPVLQYLLEQDKRANFYYGETNRLTAINLELKFQISSFDSIVNRFQQELMHLRAVVDISDASAEGWKDSYNKEVAAHNETKKKGRRRIVVVIIGAVVVITASAL